MFVGENVSEAGDGKFVGFSHYQENIRRADGDEIVDSLHCGGLGSFFEKMFSGLGPLGDGGAGVENQRRILLDAVFA